MSDLSTIVGEAALVYNAVKRLGDYSVVIDLQYHRQYRKDANGWFRSTVLLDSEYGRQVRQYEEAKTGCFSRNVPIILFVPSTIASVNNSFISGFLDMRSRHYDPGDVIERVHVVSKDERMVQRIRKAIETEYTIWRLYYAL